MRILYVEANEDGTVGGSHRAVFDLVRNLDSRRFDPHVLFYQSNPYEEMLSTHGVSVDCWEDVRGRERQETRTLARFANRLRAILRRARYLRQCRIDLLHLNNRPLAGVWDWLPASYAVGIPVIAHCRGIPHRPDRRLARWLWRHYAAYLPVSDHVADSLLAAGIDENKIQRVYDGLDFDMLSSRVTRPPSDVRQEFQIGTSQLMAAMVGHLHPWKGQDRVLEAIAELPDVLRNRLRVVFVGEAPNASLAYKHMLESSVAKLGLGKVVHFAGAREDALAIMNAADFVLHASTRPEPFGLVVLEAMACGRPVIASRLGGPSEIITEGTGLIFEPGEVGRLARHLERLIKCPELRQELSERAPARARDFAIERTAAEVSSVYEALLAPDSNVA